MRQALDRWEPRAQVTHLDAGPHPEAHDRLEITLYIGFDEHKRPTTINFSMDLAGEQS